MAQGVVPPPTTCCRVGVACKHNGGLALVVVAPKVVAQRGLVLVAGAGDKGA